MTFMVRQGHASRAVALVIPNARVPLLLVVVARANLAALELETLVEAVYGLCSVSQVDVQKMVLDVH
jgi:hypothetical protein